MTAERLLALPHDPLVAVGSQVRDDLLAAKVGRPGQSRVVAPGVTTRALPDRAAARATARAPRRRSGRRLRGPAHAGEAARAVHRHGASLSRRDHPDAVVRRSRARESSWNRVRAAGPPARRPDRVPRLARRRRTRLRRVRRRRRSPPTTRACPSRSSKASARASRRSRRVSAARRRSSLDGVTGFVTDVDAARAHRRRRAACSTSSCGHDAAVAREIAATRPVRDFDRPSVPPDSSRT